MKNLICGALAAVVICLFAVLAHATPVESKDTRSPSEEELIFLSKLLIPLRDLTERAAALESFVAKAAEGDEETLDMAKRQGAWDMDYGWGGGRFGKRAQSVLKAAAKRYDMYGMSGRFGRDVSRLQQVKGHASASAAEHAQQADQQ